MTYSKDKITTHLNIAKEWAKRSKAQRLKVGAVLVKDDRSVGSGFNGMPAGGDNTCEYWEDNELKTKPEVAHAELNAIGYAARDGKSTQDCIMVTTHSPCFSCAKLILAAGIKHVYYEQEYRVKDSIKFLKDNKVKVTKIGE